jgi:CheY-like chemotaxis protein/anti-sigma regulatory factor (Ser/Thr protein kinase)
MTNAPEHRPDGAATARLLAESVGHSLRTPLHSVLGFGELLMMTELDDDQQRLVEQVMGGTDQLLAACNRLMLLMRAFSDEPAPSPQPFDLAGLLGDVQAIASPATPIRVAVDGDVPGTLVGDAESIRQVLTELVANALIHGRQPVGIRVEAAGSGADQRLPVRFTVTDAGPGLPQDQVARLTGAEAVVPEDARQLGLYLAARLAHRLVGRLSAEPPAAGGCAVSLLVTLRRPASVPLRVQAPGVAVEGRSLQILLVEDNSINRLLTERQMARLGHRLDTVTNGRDGVTRALAGEYDVILMDRHLPDLDGVEATQRIRAAESGRPARGRVPIIAVTADAGRGHREECLAAGMDGFLTKPVDLEHLRAALLAAVPDVPAVREDVNLDLSVLDELTKGFDGGGELALQMMRTYLSELPGRRLRLQTAVRQAAPRRIVVAADGLRAASLTIGAMAVARVCGALLDSVATGSADAGQAALAELLGACQRTTEELSAILASPGQRVGAGLPA